MSERPIIMSGESVRAILAGTKTQTRRVVKLPSFDRVGAIVPSDGAPSLWDALDTTEPEFPRRMVWHSIECPHGVPGDRLWVRETWRAEPTPNNWRVRYRADDLTRVFFDRCSELERASRSRWGIPMWRSPFHLYRWASRLTLELTDVRVQRLQEISEEDAEAEGLRRNGEGLYIGARNSPWTTAGAAFFSLWDALNDKRSPWASNPFCWVLTFTRV